MLTSIDEQFNLHLPVLRQIKVTKGCLFKQILCKEQLLIIRLVTFCGFAIFEAVG